MSSFIFKWVLNRLIRDNQWNKFGVEDPYYEDVLVDVKKNGEKKYKRIKRKDPEGISNHDSQILQEFRKRAYRYDYWFKIFGVQFGWANIVSVVPVVGTVIQTYWSLSLLWLARKIEDGFPLDLQLLFLLNIAIDFGLGLIPVVGSIVEIGYKANSRNFLLLEKHLVRVGEKNMGIIAKEEVRPGFINDKVSPYVDETYHERIVPFVDDTLKPGAIKAGEQMWEAGGQVLDLLQRKSKTRTSSSGSSTKGGASGGSTTQTSNTTVTASAVPRTDSPVADKSNRDYLNDDSRSIRSIKTLTENNGKSGKSQDKDKDVSSKSSLSHHDIN
ncbi:uncharacterized protein LODBEIA_P07860 [Lodderomyces beijingensis]|uniref:Uncharacterized protein n=1 Tax=Lodderomyces beijingensis TaxID=1775926 RepID=A0ABP0ZGN7_9ASCO